MFPKEETVPRSFPVTEGIENNMEAKYCSPEEGYSKATWIKEESDFYGEHTDTIRTFPLIFPTSFAEYMSFLYSSYLSSNFSCKISHNLDDKRPDCIPIYSTNLHPRLKWSTVRVKIAILIIHTRNAFLKQYSIAVVHPSIVRSSIFKL